MSKEEVPIINIIYNINRFDRRYGNINIFGSKFVENNKNICKMIIDEKVYEVAEQYNIKDYANNELKIKLEGINNITNMSYMFNECSSLSSLSDISKLNTNNVNDMNNMFYWCSSLKSLPDISNWNANNVIDMNYMFSECSSLISLPDIQNGILIKLPI